MSSKNLTRRLERLEAELTPENPQVLTITFTRADKPGEVQVFRLRKLKDHRGQPWRRRVLASASK